MKHKYLLSIILFIVIFISKTTGQPDTTVGFRFEREVLDESNIVITNELNKQEVVSASRSSKNLWDLPVTVYIVTRDEILQNGYVTLVDVMKNVPGIKVSQPGSGEDGETFLMRGLLGNNYAKILINGIPIQPSVSMSMPIGAQLPIRQAIRIEIIFGPASAVYGSDATTGVINIITKEVNSNYFAQADLIAGTHGYSSMNFTVGGKAGKNRNILEYVLYGSKTEFKDMNILFAKDSILNPMMYFSLNGDSSATQFAKFMEKELTKAGLNTDSMFQQVFGFTNYKGSMYNPDVSKIPHESKLFGIDLKYKKLRLTYNFLNRKDHSSIGFTPLLFKYDNPDNFNAENMQRTTINYDSKIWKFLSNTTLSYNNYRLDERSSRAITYVPEFDKAYKFAASDDIFFDQLFTFSPDPEFELVGGVNYQYSSNLAQTNDLPQPFDAEYYKPFDKVSAPSDPVLGNFGNNFMTFYNLSAFMQVYFKYKKFTLMAGSRHDHHSKWGAFTSPRLALLFRVNQKSAIRASIGQAYKAPSASIAYASLGYRRGKDSVEYEMVPNPDLKPEKFYSFELGYRRIFFDRLLLDTYIYTYNIENLILSVFTEVDSIKYPKAIKNYGTIPMARSNINSNAYSVLSGFQISLKYIDLIPSIKLNTTLNLHLSSGREGLAHDKVVTATSENDLNKINNFRMMPSRIGQLNIAMTPFKNCNVSIFNTWMSGWYRKFLADKNLYNQSISQIDGYYTLDFIVGYKLSRQLDTYLKVTNAFNRQYGGIDATGMDVDLRYNPQLGRNVRFGLSFRLE